MGMAMELSRLSPRNWFRREEPARREQAMMLPVSQLHRDIDRWFDEFVSNFGMPMWSSLEDECALLRPQLDVSEGEKAYNISVEVPGVAREGIDVEVRDGLLVITGEKKRERRSDGDRDFRIERSYGRFERVLELPADAREDGIEAKYHNGVLEIVVPREAGSGSSGRRRIEVRADS